MHRHVRTPCAMLQFSMYRYLPATRVEATCRGAPSGSPRNAISRSSFNARTSLPIPDDAHPRAALSAILTRPSPRVAPVPRSRKNSHCISVFDYTTQHSRAPGAKARPRGRRLQNFIVCHAEINNKTDFIFYDLYNIFLPQGSKILVVSRPSMHVCVCICVYKLCVSLSSLY